MDRRKWASGNYIEKYPDRSFWATSNNVGNPFFKDRRNWDSNNFEKSFAMDPRIFWAGNDIIEKPSAINEYPRDKGCYGYYSLIGGGDGVVNVFKAICCPLNNSLVAIKIVDIEKSKAFFDYAFARAKIMTHLKHTNILNTHCVFTATKCLWVVMPFIPGGSFQSIIAESYPDGLPEDYISTILIQVLRGLCYLHDEGYSHGNIKPGNILIDIDGSVTLADFLSASINPDCDSTRNVDETPSYWIAPELRNRALSPEADIWSFGITALELAHGSRVPISEKPTSKSLLKRISKRFRYTEHYDKEKSSFMGCHFSQAFKDMVSWCLREDPSKRPSAQDLMTHPFFRNCHLPEFLVEELLMDLPHDVEQRFLKAESERLQRINRDLEVNSSMGENVAEKNFEGWKFNNKEFELDPVLEGATISMGKDFDENVGISGTVSLGKKIDENFSINGTLSSGKKIDENVGSNGCVPPVEKIDENVGINGSASASSGKKIDENVGVNGSASSGKKIDENVGTNGTVSSGKKIDENVVTRGNRYNAKVVESLVSLEKRFFCIFVFFLFLFFSVLLFC